MNTAKITKQAQKDFLKNQLSTNPTWAKIALIRIYDNQTDAEKNIENTTDYNGIGFTGTDGRLLSSFAYQLITRKSLSPRQMEILMSKMSKYWKQILMISDIEKLNRQIMAA